jgi:hypothetical protein
MPSAARRYTRPNFRFTQTKRVAEAFAEENEREKTGERRRIIEQQFARMADSHDKVRVKKLVGHWSRLK